jgi:hypothetical protein
MVWEALISHFLRRRGWDKSVLIEVKCEQYHYGNIRRETKAGRLASETHLFTLERVIADQ